MSTIWFDRRASSRRIGYHSFLTRDGSVGRGLALLCAFVVLIIVAGCSPTAKLTAEEAAYIDAMEAQTKELDESWERFVVLMDPSNPLPTWTAGMAAEGEVWKQLYEDAQDLTPPARFTELHEKNLEMLKLLTTAGHDFAYAGTHNNVFYLSSGARYYADAAKLAVEVKDLVKDAR